MKDIIIFSLGAFISAAFGMVIAYLAVGWVGKDIVLWGCIVLIFFGIVIGIGHTVIEGIVIAAILGAGGYFFVNKIPAFVLYVPGALAGFSIFMIVIGLIAASKEAPQREAQERAWQEQDAQEQAKWKAEQEALEARWQERRKKVATLPAPTPKADVSERLNAFRTYLNRVWHRLPQQLFERNDANYQLVNTWLQRQFIKIVVKPLGCQIELFYGDYDCEFDEELPGGETWAPETPEYQPMEIWVNEIYTFDMLVGGPDCLYDNKPPFDYMRVFKETDSEEGSTEAYIPFDGAQFELRPASWIPTD
jgi:hypothetical protein